MTTDMMNIETQQNGQLAVLASNWLDTNTNYGDPGGGWIQTTSNQQLSNCYYQSQGWPYYYPVYVSSPSRPIKLGLSEVERLRKAAKADAKLKEAGFVEP